MKLRFSFPLTCHYPECVDYKRQILFTGRSQELARNRILSVCDPNRPQPCAVTPGLEQYIFPLHGIPWIPARDHSYKDVATEMITASRRFTMRLLPPNFVVRAYPQRDPIQDS